jgi:hypothetical protein
MEMNRLKYRFNITLPFIVGLIYVLLIVLPFYVYGLHLLPNADGGLYDPKGMPLYSGGFGSSLRLIAILTMVLFPLTCVSFGGIGLLTLLRRWQALSRWERYMGIIVLSASVALLLFTVSPMGRVIGRWFMD